MVGFNKWDELEQDLAIALKLSEATWPAPSISPCLVGLRGLP
eukprot:CAMPEP_0204159466 /NCGR_PEP_ID=MMETSP0361-20130328/33034_1 /ASSEMBLY_ACC=CAM_ASM_000343 /TAXON_ID=268821 /ORGANISM="Scrippsiella Hangoei, Strain SHTV-5" /LENGTH=41 /DNA_ID= /DNA_START= /DNA_END= /DNA_ORIENTATION=